MFWLVGAIALIAVSVFLSGLYDESFIDEYAYITQSYYSDLFFGGRRDDPAWLEDFALDLQPLPKYFIGPALHAANIRMPGHSDAVMWYRNTHARFGPPETLTVSRIPFVAIGVLGCLALFGCGLLIGGRRIGAIAALLLVANPLYRLHAHRAMSDVPCETFVIASLGLGLWGLTHFWPCRRLGWGILLLAAAGIFSGLAIVCKLNGLLSPMVLWTWYFLALLTPARSHRPRPNTFIWRVTRPLNFRRGVALAAGITLSAWMCQVTMIALNPTLTCQPIGRVNPQVAQRLNASRKERFQEIIKYRFEATALQKQIPKFFRDVVRTPEAKTAVLAIQGFGRFGALGPSSSNSEVRYDPRQDWGVVLWGPLVLCGLFRSYRMGRSQLRDGNPPTGLAIIIWALLSWAVVAAYLPLAWDRYFLPIQAPNALLGAVGLSGLWERWRRKAVAP
jgi:4-amino-4-deoxy-L-arabinose transferase-like glycosyltransferase